MIPMHKILLSVAMFPNEHERDEKETSETSLALPSVHSSDMIQKHLDSPFLNKSIMQQLQSCEK